MRARPGANVAPGRIGRLGGDVGATEAVGEGRAELIEDPEQIRAGLSILMARYGDMEFVYNDTVLGKTLLIKVAIEAMTGKKDLAG